MSLKECKNIDINKYELEVTVDAETFAAGVDKVFKRKVKNINVPGFRKGKAPKHIVEKMYGQGIFYDDAVNELYPEALNSAIDESGLKVIRDKIDIKVTAIGKEGLTFTATVTTYPEVSIKDYLKLKYVPKSTEVTDEIIDQEIDNVRSRNARVVTVEDRPAQAGDITVIDFKGFKDGIAFEGGEAENYSLTLGDGQFIPGFEEKLLGHSAGEEFTIDVTFPEDYPEEELAGADAQFDIKIHEIKMRELPELDDEFVKDVSEKSSTVAEYREEMAAVAKARLEAEANRAKEHQICEQLIDLVVADIPEAMFEIRIDNIIENLKQRLQSQNLNYDIYLDYLGMTNEEFREQHRAQAENDVKLNLAATKIVELENITASEEQIEEEFARLADMYKIDVEKVKQFIPREHVETNLQLDNAMKLVMDSAKESKTTKKTTTKRTTKKKVEEDKE
ncbi:MAG: trigger factor [Clostridia bacterium]|nr:trigger factor [Clostridia bacterium]